VVTPSDASLSVSFTAGASNGEEISNYEYSINDNPHLINRPTPSILDPNTIVKYMDNLPG
jgi:hypothetical protein